MLTSTKYMQNQVAKMSSGQINTEFFKCREYPFYFIWNYVSIPEIGGILKYEAANMHSRMRQTVRSIGLYHKVLLMASRQLGKSTIAAAMLDWACNFYPRMPATIINANKTFALENLDKVKFIHSNLPPFLRSPLKGRGEYKTKMEYSNGSMLRTFYPSSTTSPSMLARSLTSPILYVDEAAHIPHMRLAYGSAQPTLTRARDQAKKHGYPYFILVTTTPNGTVGVGEWFYGMWQNAVDGTDIFDEDDYPLDDADSYVDNPVRNGFVRVRYKWDMDPTKDENWYQQQKRDLNFDTRMINQELDLVFVGSSNCIFSDEFLGSLKAQSPVDRIKLPHATSVNLYTHRKDLDKTDFYLIGVDSAKSLIGDYNAIEIFSYSNFVQIGEYYGRIGSLTKYAEVLMQLVKVLAPIVNNRLLLCVECNSIGNTVIEAFENATDFDYMPFIYSPDPEKRIGINTNAKTKGLIVSSFYDLVVDEPQNIKSSDLINQLNVIERRSTGQICAQSGYHDDIFMAGSLAAYVRRLSALEYEPLLGVSTILQQQRQMNQLKSVLGSSQTEVNVTGSMPIGIKYNVEEGGIEYVLDENTDNDGDDADFTPFAFL